MEPGSLTLRQLYCCASVFSCFLGGGEWVFHLATATVNPFFVPRGENVEDAFLEAAKKIYQNIQDGSLDLNAAESGVQHKPSAPQGGRLISEPQPQREGCGC